jgi:hypothetical protein
MNVTSEKDQRDGKKSRNVKNRRKLFQGEINKVKIERKIERNMYKGKRIKKDGM